MSEQDIQEVELQEQDQQVEAAEQTEEQLDEFKASMGDPSEVPEPTATKAKARKNSFKSYIPNSRGNSSVILAEANTFLASDIVLIVLPSKKSIF